MKIKYLGPHDFVEVRGFGPHLRSEVKDYPDEVGRELLATARRQKFEAVKDEAPQEAPGGPQAAPEPAGGPEAGEGPTNAPAAPQAAKKGKGKGGKG